MLSHHGKGLLLLLVLFSLGAAPALAVDFNAFWQYRESGGDGIESRSSFQQRYSLGAGTGLSFQPTHAISAAFNLGYSRTQSDVGAGTATTEELVPSANLNIINDIFRASLFATATESRRSQRPDLSAHSWDATLGSNWQRTYWPNLWLNYGEGAETSGDRQSSNRTDSRDSRWGLGLDWDLWLAELHYAYNKNRNEEELRQSRSESDAHFARLETGGNFLRNRLNWRLSQQYQQSTSDFSALIPEGGVFARKLEGGVTLSALGDPAVEGEPEFIEFIDTNPLLSNNDREGLLGPALSITPLERAHLGMRFNLNQQIDQLHVYLDPFTVLAPTQIDTLQWDLYTRNLLDGFWELAAANVPATYNNTDNRFELTINRQEREFKVVVTNFTGITLHLTELEAIGFLDEGTESRQTTHLTTASVRIRLTSTLAAATGLSLEKNDSQSGQISSDSSRRSLSGSLRWTPVPTVTPSVGFSESRHETTGEPEAISRSYSLIVATFPLPTFNVTLGAIRSDRYTDARRTATSDTYSLVSTARIYPDLTAAFNTTYVMSSREQADGGTLDIDTFSSRLHLNARLSPRLSADLTGNHRQTETATSTTSSSDTTLSLAYRPSDLLSMRLTGIRYWSDANTPDTLAFNLNLVLLRTPKTRANFRYSRIQGAQTVNGLGLDGSWDINPSLALQSRINYMMADADTWDVLASLALRL